MIAESAEREGDAENIRSRQEDVSTFWEDVEKHQIEPLLKYLEPSTRMAVLSLVFTSLDGNLKKGDATSDLASKADLDAVSTAQAATHPEKLIDSNEIGYGTQTNSIEMNGKEAHHNADEKNLDSIAKADVSSSSLKPETPSVDSIARRIKEVCNNARKSYRISPTRIQRIQEALNSYVGTCNYHNYTVQKEFLDPSAKRVINSFKASRDPIRIGDTEWLSLKVHGQSFMMHQIRKMVSMAALVIRCGCTLDRIRESFGPSVISIPKVPGQGLLLERPIFDSYNQRAEATYGREKLDFDKYKDEVEEFKRREIYDRIFREEERDNR
jgi:tRNA pseudouridine38-40 synthase